MKFCQYKNIINTVFAIAIAISCLIMLPFAIDQIVTDNSISLLLILALTTISAIVVFMPMTNLIVANVFKCQVKFDDGKISYKGKSELVQNLNLRFLSFQLSFLETDLVIPQLVISGPDVKLIKCYISKKDVKKLIDKFGYKIKFN